MCLFLENHGGSISAEHGLGVNKNHLIARYSKSPRVMSIMNDVKKLFDPKVSIRLDVHIVYCSFAGYSKPLQNSSLMLSIAHV